MVYEPGVPAASQRISDTQSPIQENFTVLNDIFDEDHIKYDDESGDPPPPGLRGFHQKSTYVKQDANPSAFEDIGTVFTSDNGDGLIELRYRGDSGVVANGKLLTLSAMKVMAAWNTDTADGSLGAGAIFQRYNIGDIFKETGSDIYKFTITFADKLNTAGDDTNLEYIVLTATGVGVNLPGTEAYLLPTLNTKVVMISRKDISRMSLIILTV